MFSKKKKKTSGKVRCNESSQNYLHFKGISHTAEYLFVRFAFQSPRIREGEPLESKAVPTSPLVCYFSATFCLRFSSFVEAECSGQNLLKITYIKFYAKIFPDLC